MATFGTGVGGASNLNGLSDVNTGASPANGSVLVYATATDTWGAGSVVSGSTIALNGLTDVTGTSTAGLPLVRKSSSYGFEALGSGGIADDAVITSKVPAKAITLAKISAGDSTTSGHVMTVSGSTGDVVAAALPDIDIEAVFGITASPAANQIIKRNSANSAWIFAADATGGGGGGGSGIALTDLSATGIVNYDSGTGAFSTDTAELATAIDGIVAVNAGGGITKTKDGNTITLTVPAVPAKASATDLAQGTNDTNFVTAKGVRSMQKSVDDGTEWTGFTFQSATDTPGEGRWSRVNNDFYFASTDANVTKMDDIFGENSNFRITKDASNTIVGEVAYAWRVGDVFGFRAKGTPTQTGDLTAGSVTLHATGGLYEDLQEQGFITNTDLVEGTDIDLTIGSDGKVTIAYSGTGGVDYANQTEVDAGTITNKAVNPATLHGALDKVPHVGSYAGFENTTSTGASMPLGSWHINSDGTVAYYRAHTTTQHDAMFAEFENGKRCQQESARGEVIDYQFAAVPTEHAIDGQSVGYIKCTIGDHSAIPSNPSLAGDWSINPMPAQNKEVLEHAPVGSVKGFAIAQGAVGQTQMRGQVQECRMFMDNDTNSRNQNIRSDATTDFGTGTVTTDSAGNVKSWAIGGGTNIGEHFDQRDNFSLISGDTHFCQFRAEDGGVYSVQIDGSGVFYMKHADTDTPRAVGLEVGLQFGEKDPAASDWSAWAHCGNTDISRTIDGVSTLVYDASAFYGNSNFLSGQNKSIFRTKGSVVRQASNASIPADIGPPFFAAFVVGRSGAPFPVNDRDYRFRFVFYAPALNGQASGRVWIQRIYNYTEKMLANRRV